MAKDFDLQRFLDAQSPVYLNVVNELKSGQKQSHWMWFIFPQALGLGQTPTAVKYSIRSKAEASAYLSHPVMGRRLRECTELVNAITNKTAHDIFGFPDELKFRSCMTLFKAVAENKTVFQTALDKYYRSEDDELTMKIIRSWME